MKFKIKTGVKRIILAIGIPWVFFWGFLAWRGYQMSQDAHHIIDLQPPGARIPLAALEALEGSNRHLFHAIAFGAGLPIGICGLILLGLWIRRGFR